MPGLFLKIGGAAVSANIPPFFLKNCQGKINFEVCSPLTVSGLDIDVLFFFSIYVNHSWLWPFEKEPFTLSVNLKLRSFC